MEVLLVMAVAASNLICFVMGVKVAQSVNKGEDVKLPTINPIEAYKAHEAKKSAEAELNRIDTIMRNIEGYDGTSYGQQDVPERG